MTAGYGDLPALVTQLRYKPGWRFRLRYGATAAARAACLPDLSPATTAGGATIAWSSLVTLVVCVHAEDTSTPGRLIILEHPFAVPPDPPGPGMPWHRWLLNRIRDVETHEMCEAFRIGPALPFYPEHGPGADLYRIIDRGLPEGWQLAG